MYVHPPFLTTQVSAVVKLHDMEQHNTDKPSLERGAEM